ncbi:hypothetical protein TEA_000062 [Camellia sinensis var. sinensis]|uniref:Homeobox-leucine zipper protein n=1 Tax=Camellia sinensis var. sinensis TaxID=542762 RepID=A0A4V3WN58_CAMSN|nr:hypothetical protein TEA_000062 [Camellia sinensis var. sinensis]
MAGDLRNFQYSSMDSGRLFFDPSCQGNIMFIGNGDPAFRVFVTSDTCYLPVHLLEKSFETENKLEPERKSQLANKLGLQPRQVAVWFQNRRARWKTKQLERDFDLLKSSYDSLLSDYDSIHTENHKLKVEVLSLTEKLQAKEVAAGAPIPAPKSDPPPLPPPPEKEEDIVTHTSTIQLNVKAEDHLSTGSGGSAVVDEDGPQLVDSGDSYFLNNDYPGCVVQSVEDDGSEDGRGYLRCLWRWNRNNMRRESHWAGGSGLKFF